jgi:hypothetical protein
MEHVQVPRRVRRSIGALLALHTALLAAYTLPEAWVPPPLRALATAHARPLFHQGWTLFAPDPPRCACELQVGIGEHDWRALDGAQDHYLVTRMARNTAAYLDGARPLGDTLHVDPMLWQAMHALVRDIGREVPELRFRAVQRCVTDDRRPQERTLRIVPVLPAKPPTP